MNLKSKIFGTLTATVVALSMMTGAVAEEVNVTTNLGLHEGACGIKAVGSTNLNYGNWEWDGNQNKYVQRAGATDSQSLTLRAHNSKPGGSCVFQFKFDGLTGANPSNTIPSTAFTVSNVPVPMNWGPKTLPIPTNFVEETGQVKLNVPNNVQPDNYQGTLTFTVTDTD